MVEVPKHSCVIPDHVHSLLCHISAGDIDGSRCGGLTTGSLEYECSIDAAVDTVCAGYRIKGIVGFLLPCVVYHHNADAQLVRQLFQRPHRFVIGGILIPGGTLTGANFLECVDDNKLSAGMLPDKTFDLLFQTLTDLLRQNCEIKLVGGICAVHLV